ncbi:MAG: hypothetical protein ACKVRN_16555 [Pyrinomonadaceae bacterium]
MVGKNIFRKFVSSTTAAAVLCVYSMVAFALPVVQSGEITVTGQVTINGQPAVSGSSVMSGAVIVAGANSSAVVSLGKLGRVEVLADSNATLNFTANSIIVNLASGQTRVSNSAGTAATVTTKDAMAIADISQANNFLVHVECLHTHVDTTSGLVTLRSGSTDKQVAAGTSAETASLNQAGCPPCLRPNSAPAAATIGMPWLLLLAAGAAGVGIILATQEDDSTFGGGTNVISTNR